MNDESDSRMVRLPVRDMRDEPAPQRAAQEGDLPPLLTDEQIDALPLPKEPDHYEKLAFARAIESEVRLALAAAGGGVPTWHPTDEEKADDNRGIRWVWNGEICGRPTAHDVREYLLRRKGQVECSCQDCEAFYTAAPEAPAQAAPSAGEVERVLAYLDDLKDDAAVHIWPDDLEKCQTSECVVEVYSVRMGSPDGKTVPLFSRDQVAEAVRAALSHKEQP